MEFQTMTSLVAVAFLWGATNPLIKLGSKGIENVVYDSKIKQFIMELKFLLFRYQYIIPFALNQMGSVLYVYTLGKTELSLAVPVANSLSFVFTAIVARLVGEQKANKQTYLGMLLITAGTFVCMYDKIKRTESSVG